MRDPMASLKKRIEALEAKMLSRPLTLYFAAGSTQTWYKKRGFIMDLLIVAMSDDPRTPEQAEQLALIRQCLPDRDNAIDLIKSMQLEPEELAMGDGEEGPPAASACQGFGEDSDD